MSEVWWKIKRADRLKKLLAEHSDWRSLYSTMFGWSGVGNMACYAAKEKHLRGSDAKPSMSVLDDLGAVTCHTCGEKASSYLGVIEAATGKTFEQVCRNEYGRVIETTIDEKIVKRLHSQLMSDKKILADVKSKMRLTHETIVAHRLGWSTKRRRLMIPITCEFGYVVDIRGYDLYKQHDVKVVSWAKGFGAARLWPHSTSQRCVLVEGEKDCLIALQAGLPAQTITSGGRTFPKESLKYFTGKTVFAVGDNDPTGRVGARKRAREIAAVAKSSTIVTLPVKGEKEDMWDWLCRYDGSAEKFWELSAGESAEESDGLLPEDEVSVMMRDAMSSGDKDVTKAVTAFEAMRQGGWFYKTEQGVYYANANRCVLASRRDPNFLAYLIRMAPAMNRETPDGRVAMAHIESASLNHAKQAESSNQFYYTRACKSLYFKADFEAQQLNVAQAGGYAKARNGQNDANVLLTCDDHALKSFKMDDGIDADKAIQELWTEVFEFMPMANHSRFTTLCWFVASMFKQVTPDRPILRFTAPTASGKSHVIRMLSYLMYGNEYLDGPATTVASLATLSVKRPMLFIDNIEMEHVMGREGLNDLFISLATCVAKEKRRMGTDTDVVVEKPECVTATTGIEPFAKSEIVNRFLYCDVDRVKFGRPDYLDFERFEIIRENRDRWMSAIIEICRRSLHEVDVDLIATTRYWANTFRSTVRYPVYLAVMEIVGKKIAAALKIENARAAIEMNMGFHQEQIDNFSNAGNPVVTWLETWWVRTESDKFVDPKQQSYRAVVSEDGNKFEWWITPTELFNELSVVAGRVNRRVPWINPQQLSYRARDAEHALAQAGWTITDFRTNGRTRYHIVKRGALPDCTDVKATIDTARALKAREGKIVKGRKRA